MHAAEYSIALTAPSNTQNSVSILNYVKFTKRCFIHYMPPDTMFYKLEWITVIRARKCLHVRIIISNPARNAISASVQV
jgi:hypothetical protein